LRSTTSTADVDSPATGRMVSPVGTIATGFRMAQLRRDPAHVLETIESNEVWRSKTLPQLHHGSQRVCTLGRQVTGAAPPFVTFGLPSASYLAILYGGFVMEAI
jgi:hypothetical protein